MTIEQTVEIPRRIFLDLPQDLPLGKAKVEVRITPVAKLPLAKGKTDAPLLSLMDLYGSCEGEDTLDAYFERKRADKMLDGGCFSPLKENTAYNMGT